MVLVGMKDFYEEKGLDLPLSYVRWTENRNMTSFLDVVNNRIEQFSNLIGTSIDFNNAATFLNSEESKSLTKPLMIIKYDKTESDNPNPITPRELKSDPKVNLSTIKVGIIGAGGFTKNFILPNLAEN